MNEKIKSISKTELTWKNNGENHKIKIEDENTYPNTVNKHSKKDSSYEFRLENCIDCNDKKIKLSSQNKFSRNKWEGKVNLVQSLKEVSAHA
jgi:hypothetical protein